MIIIVIIIIVIIIIIIKIFLKPITAIGSMTKPIIIIILSPSIVFIITMILYNF